MNANAESPTRTFGVMPPTDGTMNGRPSKLTSYRPVLTSVGATSPVTAQITSSSRFVRMDNGLAPRGREPPGKRLLCKFESTSALKRPTYFRITPENVPACTAIPTGLRSRVRGPLHSDGPARGMIADFDTIKTVVRSEAIDVLDHQNLNDFMENPTAEQIVMWIWRRLDPQLKGLDELVLWETSTSCAVLRRSDFGPGA